MSVGSDGGLRDDADDDDDDDDDDEEESIRDGAVDSNAFDSTSADEASDCFTVTPRRFRIDTSSSALIVIFGGGERNRVS